MSGLAFDTHAFVKRLTAAGMPEAQAEVLADQQSRLIDEKLASKADLAEATRLLKTDLAEATRLLKTDLAVVKEDLAKTEAVLRAGIRETELRLEAKIEAGKSELIKWMFGTIGFQTVIILGAVAALARFTHP
jgi:hypothetical protein